jgi:hypothetical protein
MNCYRFIQSAGNVRPFILLNIYHYHLFQLIPVVNTLFYKSEIILQ